MTKTQAERLYKALCACTCNPGSHAPFDSVCVHDKKVYATNSFVLHRVEGLFQSELMFHHLYSHYLTYANRVDILDRLLKYDKHDTDFSNVNMIFNPRYIELALRPHKALDNNVFIYNGMAKSNAPLIITSQFNTLKDPIIITTAIQGCSIRKR